jgi:hypothetical protein
MGMAVMANPKKQNPGSILNPGQTFRRILWEVDRLCKW